MHFEAHAGAGWLIGNLPPQADRGLRNWCLAAAVLPDADAVSFLFGPQAYGRWHHTLGHNVFVGIALTGLALWHQRKKGWGRAALVGLLVACSFAVHVLTDAKLSAYATKLFWPFSHTEYEFSSNLGLASPINTYLVYASLLAVFLIALWRKVTPLEVLSPALDRLLLSPLRPRPLACSVCGQRCGNRCEACGAALCLHHSRITGSLRITCASCPPPDG
jgi:hypothetical protein